jgi:hypothetical protein
MIDRGMPVYVNEQLPLRISLDYLLLFLILFRNTELNISTHFFENC